MTGYHLSVGYNSRLSTLRKNEAWVALLEIVATIRQQPLLIAEEAFRESHSGSIGEFMEYAAQYIPSVIEDDTIKILDPIGEDAPGQVMQLASGGGHSRDMKEQLRRAFCRLVIFEMHKRRLEVNLVVA